MLKDWMPPVCWRMAKRLIGKMAYSKVYPTYLECAEVSPGYADHALFKCIVKNHFAALNQQDMFEQDGLLVPPRYAYPVLSHIMQMKFKTGKLRVLDFGGALGSSFDQARRFMGSAIDRWVVVEQPHFVQFGQEKLTREGLVFETDIETAKSHAPNVILASAVLPYLEQPIDMLQALFDIRADKVIIDRLPVISGKSRIVHQALSPEIHGVAGGYPLHLFNETEFMAAIPEGYTLKDKFASIDGVVESAQGIIDYQGYVFERHI